MKVTPPSKILIALITPIIFGSCDKVRIVSQDQVEAEAKLASLQTENTELLEKIATLRQVLPPIFNTAQAAKDLAAKNQADNQLIQMQFTKAVKNFEGTQAALKILERELEEMQKAIKH